VNFRFNESPVHLLQNVVAMGKPVSFVQERSSEIMALDDALETLAKVDERKCRIIELRFFGGFSVEETAQALGISASEESSGWRKPGCIES
jgi:DNA-directed RNA polymerase specialized sigma24 family protein